MIDETKIKLAKIIAATLGILAFFAMLAWVGSPTNWSFKLEMDNNTLEAIKSLNETGDNLVTAAIDAHYKHQARTIEYTDMWIGNDTDGEWFKCKVAEHSANRSNRVYSDKKYQIIIFQDVNKYGAFCELRELESNDWMY